jgi:hypothetical protein
MSLRRSHHILVLLLVMVMTSVSAWASGAGGLAHQLEHAFAGAAAADAPHHHHAQQPPHSDPADAGSTAGTEHQMMHAVDHLQFFHGSGVQARLALKAIDADPLRFVAQPLPLASIDPPFRPPRTPLLPA